MFKKIKYSLLNARQKENYNFQKVSGVLADYGYTCIRLSDDWNSADFIAIPSSKNEILRIQLKARFTIDKKYLNKDLFIACPIGEKWFIYSHDAVVKFCKSKHIYTQSASWTKDGLYSTVKPNELILDQFNKNIL